MTGASTYSSNGNILELFQQMTFTQRVSLSVKKPNMPDSTAPPPPSGSVIILHRAERKPSVAGESILTRQLSQPLQMQEQPHRWRPHCSDWWKQVQSVYSKHTNMHTLGGVKLTHTPAWVVSLPWQPVIDPLSYVARERARILMMGKKKQRRMESDGIVGEKTVSMHTEAHTNVPREGSKKFVFGHVCKATLSRCRLSCSILSCCSLLIVWLTVLIVWTFAVTHADAQYMS